jgi:cytochrome c-type biogenesis protein CcmE
MKRNVVISAVLVVVCILVAVNSMKGSTVSSVRFADLPTTNGEACQVYGVLDGNSIRTLKGWSLVEFRLTEEKTGKKLNVLYDNPNSALPANFPSASHAKVTGTYDKVTNKFVGVTVLTKCPSKYDGKSELDLKKSAAR